LAFAADIIAYFFNVLVVASAGYIGCDDISISDIGEACGM